MSGSNTVLKHKQPVRSPAKPSKDNFTSKVLPPMKSAKPTNQMG